MLERDGISMISERYREVLGAVLTPDFATYMHSGESEPRCAALGYRRAGPDPLFLERYLDRPIEEAVSLGLGQHIARDQIVEIGNFAATNTLAMIQLWGIAANDLGNSCEVAVATLTAPLRRMFMRIGLPITVLGPADVARLGEAADAWGRYYDLDPQVCAGVIADGQSAINAFIQRQQRRKAA